MVVHKLSTATLFHRLLKNRAGTKARRRSISFSYGVRIADNDNGSGK